MLQTFTPRLYINIQYFYMSQPAMTVATKVRAVVLVRVDRDKIDRC